MTSAFSLNRRSMILMTLALAACKTRNQIIEFSGFTMGTSYRVAAVDPEGKLAAPEVKQAVDRALVAVNARLSNWDATSEVSRLNAAPAGAFQPLSDELSQVMAAAATVHAQSAGRFDTAIGPLIELWGFGAPGKRPMPAPDAIDAARAASAQGRALDLAAGKAAKRRDDAQVYLAGIGKGYGADRVGQVLAGFGLTDYMVEIGGDLVTAGRNPDGLPWQIGVESPNPGARAVMAVVGLRGGGLATSGDYRNYFEVEGQRYSHLIDPTTGRPVAHRTASATVMAENGMLADAWSTAMLILGRDAGLEVAKAHGIAVQFIDRAPDDAGGFETTLSPAFEALSA